MTLQPNTWIYWIFNERIYQGWFLRQERADVFFYHGMYGTIEVAYPLKDVRLFSKYPSATHFGMHKTENGYVDERAC